MKKLNKLILSFLLLMPLTTQFIQAEFRFDYDFCVFKNQDSRLALEFYYSFYLDQLKFDKTNDGYEASALLDLEIIDKSNSSVVLKQPFNIPVSVKDTTGILRANNTRTGQLNIILDSGQYVFRVKATDFKHSADTAKYEDNLSLSRFVESKVAISCVQISTGIEKSNDDNSPFYKNTLEVTPNPLRFFGNNLSKIHYYFELYNLTKENISNDYIVKSEITDLNDVIIKENEKKYSVKAGSKVEVGTFDISDLKTNTYKLIIKIIDDKNNEVIRNQKKFIIYNPDSTVTTPDLSKENYQLSDYAVYPEDKLDEEFKLVSYIATDKEKEQYDNMNNLEGKRKFMFEFWKSKSITKIDYMRRVKFANDNYAFDFTDGWKTDRGRVYVTYGPPDDIERFPFESDKRAYETWRYNSLQGGVIFVFVDLSNASGNYGLVHSTARNELRNDSWQSRLRIK
ncbi:MAG: GWxTD domain-containing protein [Ignavibacteriae bacterium]|nr:MAG: GWxTD domain-containing protein [Ignavibacteriota bacterium]